MMKKLFKAYLTRTKTNKSKGFTLIELMITVAIVGILAAITLPSYNNYVTRAKIQEGMYFLEKAKLNINIYHQDGGDLSALNNSNQSFIDIGLKKNINSDYIKNYWLGPWTGNDISIWVLTQSNSDLPSDASGKWPVYLVGNVVNREIKWVCKSDYHGDKHKKYVPSKCR